jgi:hypothetical protein
MSIEIRVLEEKSIGRYFQATALGYILDMLPGDLRSKILEGFREGLISLNSSEVSQILNNLASSLRVICNVKKAAPTLYKAGKAPDSKLLSTITPSTPLTGNTLNCDWLIKVAPIIQQIPNALVDMPMFLRAYVFSKYRDIGEVRGEKINAISLYIANAGTLISIIASNIQRGESKYELYIVPDTSLESLLSSHRMYTIFHVAGIGSLENYIRSLLKIESLSFELSILLSIALYIYNAITQVAGMPPLTGLYNIFEKFRVISIIPQDRPLVVWERPLTLTHMFEELEKHKSTDLLQKLYWCANRASKYSMEVTRADDIVSQCVNALFAYIETRSLDMLFSCGASALRIADQFNYLCREGTRKGRKDARELCMAEKDFADLSRDLAKLL